MLAAAHPLPVDDTAPPGAAEHFHRWLYAAVLHVVQGILESTDEAPDDLLSRFPFLAAYLGELSGHGLDGLSLDEGRAHWHVMLREWEAGAEQHLPLRALRTAAGLDDLGVTMLCTVGLVEEDARFGALFETIQGTPGARRPTAGLLASWTSCPADATAPHEAIRTLLLHGLVQTENPEAPRAEWTLQLAPALWDALRGERMPSPAPGLALRPPADLLRIEDLIIDEDLAARLRTLPPLLSQDGAGAVVVRGPPQSGRHTLLGVVARELGLGRLDVAPSWYLREDRQRSIGPLATALHALPVVNLDPAPGETIELPRLVGYDGPVGVTLGRRGGVAGPAVERAVVVTTEIPGPRLRTRHWAAGFAGRTGPDLAELGSRFRLTGGTIRRAAALARAYAALDDREVAGVEDVRTACSSLNREALDTLAARLAPVSDHPLLAVEATTERDLADLQQRCRHREHMGDAVSRAIGEQLSPGVRALFSGPSGTGKTLAARLLAASLGLDTYRVDLASVVNKYIGETEKRLDAVFSSAEQLNVVILLDEGDALLASRTSVQSANDRYANLETDFLLQRLESFTGILIVTTNAADRIDTAFQRRMDVVVQFRPPGPAERWAIWLNHLPPSHTIEPAFLELIARRCDLHGGQIRNAVLHAAVLALDAGGLIASHQIESAVVREYRKANIPCPLRLAGAGEASR